MRFRAIGASLFTVILLSGCDRSAPLPAEVAVAPADAFMAGVAKHCGQAFTGKVLVNQPEPDDDPFADRDLIMHVRECSPVEIKIPFHVGDDRSRTWVLTRTSTGLRLKHDHRHEDGTPDRTTMYGGESITQGSDVRQEFPVDAESKAAFASRNNAGSQANTWAMEVEPGRRLVYELSRPTGRLFRVEFDLASPVAAPPAPWGHQ